MFRHSGSVGLALWAGLVAAAAYGLAKDVTTWRPAAEERALSVRVGDPVPGPDPNPPTVDETKCCTPSAFDSCTNDARFWPCKTAPIACNAPPEPPNDPYTFAKYGECTHTPGQDGGDKDAVCQDPDPAGDHRCTLDAHKPSLQVKVDRCTPNGKKDSELPQPTCPEGKDRCLFDYTAPGAGDNTRTVTVKVCAANDTFCPQIDPQYLRCQYTVPNFIP